MRKGPIANIQRLPVPHRAGVIVALCVALTACYSDDMNDLRGFIDETRTKYNGQVEPLPELTPYESYRYTVADRRDPFRPVVSAVKAIEQSGVNSGVRPDTNRNREELERFPLDALKMVGILENNGETWAAVKAPDKTIYRVRKGNYLGMNYGRITRIDETKIEVLEIIPDGMGGWVKRPNSLSLIE